MKINCTDVLNDADQQLPVIPGREEGAGVSEGERRGGGVPRGMKIDSIP